ncbi:permease-like cell division protein FtsX [Rhodococcus sp. X156]|uniref:permease-like cell division protein FtsX n=1 Tax=Rhodococcus sp. X156 TaxID=2499145 RepID=UPI000FDB13AE|nr:permease-like cell division protein FtsX [Rhodococcus sp. X156]
MRVSFVLSEVFTGLRRNITMTIAMIITTAISLGLLGAGLLVVQMTNKTEQIYFDRVEVAVFLTNDISTSDAECSGPICATLREDLQNFPGVQSVEYESRTAAYERFKKVFAQQPELVQLARPEALPASFRVKLSDPKRFAVINETFGTQPGVDRVVDQAQLVERLFSVLGGVRNAAFAIAVVQALAALLLISNMIQIAAFTRRTEVSIMRLVGATRWYTQLPFLLEAVVAGLIGSALAVIGLFTAKSVFLDGVLEDLYSSNIIGQITTSDVLYVAPLLGIVGIGLSSLTAYITLRLYVRQ